MIRVLMPLPSYGFDPTEAAVPWQVLSNNNIEVVFATPTGDKACADKLMLHGRRLGIWKALLRARSDAVSAYNALTQDASFCNPIKYRAAEERQFDALFLSGGHDKGVKEYLESEQLQGLVRDFFVAGKPVAAICHGVVLAARSIHPDTGESVIYNYKTTALLKSQERSAYNLTRLWLQDYYLTYADKTVEDEVKSVLSDASNFLPGPTPLWRDSLEKLNRGFVVKDRNFVSARWPGDAYNIAVTFVDMLQSRAASGMAI